MFHGRMIFINKTRQENRRENRQKSDRMTRINISSLHYSVTTQELRDLAEKYGQVREVKIEWDNLGRSNETGFIEYQTEADARNAVDQLDGLKVEGLPMRCVLSERPENDRGFRQRNRTNNGEFRNRRRFNSDRNNRRSNDQEQDDDNEEDDQQNNRPRRRYDNEGVRRRFINKRFRN